MILKNQSQLSRTTVALLLMSCVACTGLSGCLLAAGAAAGGAAGYVAGHEASKDHDTTVVHEERVVHEHD